MARRDGSARVADALRESPPVLDEIARARMEKKIADAMRDGVPRHARSERPSRSGLRRAALGGGLVAAAAMLALGWIVWPSDPEAPVARFVIAGSSGDRDGTVEVGMSLEVADGQRAEAQIGHVALELAGGSAMRFGSVDVRDVRVELESGRVDVAFHPERRGEERLTIETPSARVEVVGTVFSVAIERAGTHVEVSEGTVRVVPRDTSASAVLVTAGGSVVIPALAQASATVAIDEPAIEVAVDAPAIEIAQIAEPIPQPIAEGDAIARAGAPRLAQRALQPIATPVVETEPAAQTVAVAPEPALEPATPPTEATTEAVATTEPRSPGAASALSAPVATPQERLSRARGRMLSGHDVAAARADLQALSADTTVSRQLRFDAQMEYGDSLIREQPQRAVEAFERAAGLARGRPYAVEALYSIGDAYRQMGNRGEARRYYLRYLDEATPGANRWEARRRVCQLGPPEGFDCGGAAP